VIAEEPILLHWNYFLALETDLAIVSRFVEFTKANFATYSIEHVHLLLAAASEVDVVMKQYCGLLAPQESCVNIKEYRHIVHEKRPQLSTSSASLPRFGLVLTPWESWGRNRSPLWWVDYNRVKHRRSEYFSKAHLKNVLNAVGGLFLLLVMYYRDHPDLARLVPAPVLFEPPRELAARRHALDGETGIFFER
jgi:hypothetical protein